jgi:hypothetical protein
VVIEWIWRVKIELLGPLMSGAMKVIVVLVASTPTHQHQFYEVVQTGAVTLIQILDLRLPRCFIPKSYIPHGFLYRCVEMSSASSHSKTTAPVIPKQHLSIAFLK